MTEYTTTSDFSGAMKLLRASGVAQTEKVCEAQEHLKELVSADELAGLERVAVSVKSFQPAALEKARKYANNMYGFLVDVRTKRDALLEEWERLERETAAFVRDVPADLSVLKAEEIDQHLERLNNLRMFADAERVAALLRSEVLRRKDEVLFLAGSDQEAQGRLEEAADAFRQCSSEKARAKLADVLRQLQRRKDTELFKSAMLLREKRNFEAAFELFKAIPKIDDPDALAAFELVKSELVQVMSQADYMATKANPPANQFTLFEPRGNKLPGKVLMWGQTAGYRKVEFFVVAKPPTAYCKTAPMLQIGSSYVTLVTAAFSGPIVLFIVKNSMSGHAGFIIGESLVGASRPAVLISTVSEKTYPVASELVIISKERLAQLQEAALSELEQQNDPEPTTPTVNVKFEGGNRGFGNEFDWSPSSAGRKHLNPIELQLLTATEKALELAEQKADLLNVMIKDVKGELKEAKTALADALKEQKAERQEAAIRFDNMVSRFAGHQGPEPVRKPAKSSKKQAEPLDEGGFNDDDEVEEEVRVVPPKGVNKRRKKGN